MIKQTSYIIATVLMLAFVQNAGAIGPFIPDPLILSVQVDVTQQCLIISGKHLGETVPQVMLGGQRLGVSHFSSNEVVVNLPANLPPATYYLSVSNPKKPSKASSLYMQIPLIAAASTY